MMHAHDISSTVNFIIVLYYALFLNQAHNISSTVGFINILYQRYGRGTLVNKQINNSVKKFR